MLVLGFFLSISIKLFAESRGLGVGAGLGLTVIGYGLLAVQVFWVAPEFHMSDPTILFLGPAVVLSIMFAPFRFRIDDRVAFWDFNRAAWLGAIFAFFATATLVLGLFAAFYALDNLLGIELPRTIYADVANLSLGLFAPWLWLASIPENFRAPPGEYCPKPIKILAGYVMAPLTIAYLAILYAYTAKIVWDWNLPNGEIGYLVSSYAIFGVITHVLVFPIRETASRPVRLFHRHFYHALFVPTGLLIATISTRIAHYGITESRFAIMVFALWLILIALAFSLRPRWSIALVPMSLAVLFCLASFGPWGATAVSTASQIWHLERALTRNGLLKDNRIKPVESFVPWADQKRISSIARYMRDTGKLDALKP